jgi:hypothetical protein
MPPLPVLKKLENLNKVVEQHPKQGRRTAARNKRNGIDFGP